MTTIAIVTATEGEAAILDLLSRARRLGLAPDSTAPLLAGTDP